MTARKEHLNRATPVVWAPEHDAYLKQHYPTTPTTELAAHFNLPRRAITERANRLKVHKAEGFRGNQIGNRKPNTATRYERTGTPTVPGQKKVKMVPLPAAGKKGYQYPMNSPEYKAWEASLLEGRQRVPVLNKFGRTDYVYRKNPTC